MVMVKLVWVLVTPPIYPRKLIVGLMVVILCHLIVDIIHPLVIPKIKSYYSLSMRRHGIFITSGYVYVVLVIVPHNYPLRTFISVHIGIMWGFSHLSIIE